MMLIKKKKFATTHRPNENECRVGGKKCKEIKENSWPLRVLFSIAKWESMPSGGSAKAFEGLVFGF